MTVPLVGLRPSWQTSTITCPLEGQRQGWRLTPEPPKGAWLVYPRHNFPDGEVELDPRCLARLPPII